MFSIAICDDEEILCSQIENYLDPYIEKGVLKTEIFYSTEKLYESILAGDYYDLIFLDIEFRYMNGVDVGKKIRNELKDEKIQIAYISAKKEYAMELFSVRPINFLIKPLYIEDVIKTIEKAMALSEIYNSCFEFKFGAEYFRIPYGDIIYFESENRKIKIHNKYGTKEMYATLDSIEKEIPINFIRIHKSYLINKLYITCLKSEKVCLIDDVILPISKSYRKAVYKTLIKDEKEKI